MREGGENGRMGLWQRGKGVRTGIHEKSMIDYIILKMQEFSNAVTSIVRVCQTKGSIPMA